MSLQVLRFKERNKNPNQKEKKKPKPIDHIKKCGLYLARVKTKKKN
jgi:hypothetical protein